MIRFIATDIDGTLLRDGAATAPEETSALIEQMAQQGVVFCAASGRQQENLRRLFHKDFDRIAYVCENGAMATLGSDVIQTLSIPRQMGQEIIKDIQARGDQVLVSGRHTSYATVTDRSFTDYMLYDLRNTITIVDDLLSINEEYLKISAFIKGSPSAAAEAYAPKWKDKLNAAIAGERWFDFTVANKGMGIGAILDKMSISPDEAVAFGDNENDIAMLDLVGHPYLMASANPMLRKPSYKLCGNVIDEMKRILAAQAE